MKYKLKFEIVYLGGKDQIRDSKINNLLKDINTEVISESPITAPSKEDVVILGDVEYSIISIKHKIEPELYTIILSVEDIKSKREREREESRISMEMLLNNYDNDLF